MLKKSEENSIMKDIAKVRRENTKENKAIVETFFRFDKESVMVRLIEPKIPFFSRETTG